MSKYTFSFLVAFLATTTLDGAANESNWRMVDYYTNGTADVVSSTVEYQAPFSVNLGEGADSAGKLRFVISPAEDWTEESNGLAYRPAGDVFGSAAAMASVGNHRELEDFSVTTDVTVGIGPHEAGHRFGLAVLGGPHLPEIDPFDPAAKETFYGLTLTRRTVRAMWLEIRKGFDVFPDHPITCGVEPFSIRDARYFNIRFREDMEGVTPILQATPSLNVREGPYLHPRGPYPHIVEAEGRIETLAWAVEREDGGRGFGFTGGHFHANWGDDNFRKIALNALVWISGAEVPEGGVVSFLTDEEVDAYLD